jgi:peptidylprolyl isomerase
MIRHRIPTTVAVLALIVGVPVLSRAEPAQGPGQRRSGSVESFADPEQTGPAEGGVEGGTPRPHVQPRTAVRNRKLVRVAAPAPAPAPAPTPTPAPATAKAKAKALAASDPVLRPADLDNTLLIETGRGLVVVELSPALAPQSVERVKRLVRMGIYDGLLFHRVIDGFVAQTGNPDNHDGGKTGEPNLPPEFTFRLGSETPHSVAARPAGDAEGLIGAMPYESVSETRSAASPDHRVTAWGAYCSGVMGMGRDASPDSGNSEIFLMREPARRLDRGYSPVGRVLVGLDVVRALAVGEPPPAPDRMLRVRVLADMPVAERPLVEVADTAAPSFQAVIDRVRAARGADFSICDIDVPARISGPAPATPPRT